MEIYKRKNKTTWYKAAVMGSTWANFEIVFGSFLHNISFPMSGSILTFIAILLIISFTQIWKNKGLILKAGLIAALMKSISPSAILLGPMTGIFIEALMLELGLSIFGRNSVGFMLGSILAMYSVFLHKIVNLLIMYGFNFVKVIENLYNFIIKQLGINDLTFLQAILLLSLFYVLLGLTASIFGIIFGKKTNKYIEVNNENFDILENQWIIETSENTKAIFIFIHIFSLIAVLVIIYFLGLLWGTIAATAYLIFCLLKYKRTRRFFTKWGFWVQIVIIMLLSVLFYNGTQKLSMFQIEGLKAGAMMILRMLVIIVAFASLSNEIRNPFVKALLYRKGFGNLYYSMNLAFSVLPVFMEKTSDFKYFVRHPLTILTTLVKTAQNIYQMFVSQIQFRKIFIVTGQIHQGKTTFLVSVVKMLKNKDIDVCGVLAIGEDQNGKRNSFTLNDIQTDEKKIFISVDPIGEKKIGRYYVDESASEYFTEKFLRNKTSKVIIVDEIGLLELKNNLGWHKLINKKFEQSDLLQIWSVRKSLVKDVIRKYHINEAYVFDVEKDNPESLLNPKNSRIFLSSSPALAGIKKS